VNQPNSELEEAARALEPPYRSRGEARSGACWTGMAYRSSTNSQRLSMIVAGTGCGTPIQPAQLWQHDYRVRRYAGRTGIHAGDSAQAARLSSQRYTAMFVYPKNLAGPAWPEVLYHRIEQAGQQAAQVERGSAGYEPTRRHC